MTTTSPIECRDSSTSRSARARAELQAALGGPFSTWRRTALGWTRCRLGAPLGGTHDEEAASDEWCEWFDRLAADWPAPIEVLPMAGGQWMAATAIEGEDEGLEVVAGCVTVDSTRLIAHAAELAMRQVDDAGLRELSEQYAPLLSASYEELTFLRRLSRHIEFCVANRSLADVAETILPQLRELMGVEGLCLIVALDALAERPMGQSPDDRPSGIVGDLPGASDFWRRFVADMGDANRRVYVKNYRGVLGRHETAPRDDVRSLVLAPIQKEGLVFGWLLGVNKHGDSCAGLSLPGSLGHDEIGSVEASLLEASALMLGSHAANHRLFSELDKLVVDVIHTLVGVIEAKDAYTCGHSDRVALIARRLGEECGLPAAECQSIYLSGLLHDIGKLGIADDVLLKPGKLSEADFEKIKQHPETGVRLLKGLRPLEKLLPGVLHHHESVDGSGYPHGLSGNRIPIMARILAVADAFDAMTSDRPYRAGMPLDRAEAILRDGAGKQWDAQVVDAFFAARDDILTTKDQWRNHLRELLDPRSREREPASESPGTEK